MKLIKETMKFLSDFLTFLGYFILAVMLFVILNILIDSWNPCSNFSDIQDVCSQ
jgi:hypothetical protein